MEKHSFNPSAAHTGGLMGFSFTIKWNVLLLLAMDQAYPRTPVSWHVSLSDTPLPIARAKSTPILVEGKKYKQVSTVGCSSCYYRSTHFQIYISSWSKWGLEVVYWARRRASWKVQKKCKPGIFFKTENKKCWKTKVMWMGWLVCEGRQISCSDIMVAFYQQRRE